MTMVQLLNQALIFSGLIFDFFSNDACIESVKLA